MSASLGIQSVMTTCAFLPNGGMITEPGPDDCAIGVAGAGDARPPGVNAGADGGLPAGQGATAAPAAAARGQRRVLRAAAPRAGGGPRWAPPGSVAIAGSP